MFSSPPAKKPLWIRGERRNKGNRTTVMDKGWCSSEGSSSWGTQSLESVEREKAKKRTELRNNYLVLTTSAPSITTYTHSATCGSSLWLFPMSKIREINTRMEMAQLEQPWFQGTSQKDSRHSEQPHKGWDWNKPDTRWESPSPNMVQNSSATVLCNLNLGLQGLPSLQQTLTSTNATEDTREEVLLFFFLTLCCQIFLSCLTLCIPKNYPKCQAEKWRLIKRAGNSHSYLNKIWGWQKMNFQSFLLFWKINPKTRLNFV